MKLHFCWTHPGLENTYTQLLFKEGIQYYKKEFNCFKWVKLFYLRLSANWRDDVPQDTSWLNKKGIFILKKRLQWGKIQIKCCKTPGMFCGNFAQLSINMTVSRWWLNTLNVFAASLVSLWQVSCTDTPFWHCLIITSCLSPKSSTYKFWMSDCFIWYIWYVPRRKNTKQAGSSVRQRTDFKILLLVFKALNGSGPKYIRLMQAGPFENLLF